MTKRAAENLEQVTVESRAAWRTWLEKHHTRSESIWLVTYKKSSGQPHLPYADIVEEALCFGWIDSLPRKLDEQRTMLLISPRKPKSPWSKLNKTRVEKLIAAGLMTPAGQAKIDQAKADGSWSVYDAAETLEEPDGLRAALDAIPEARRHWDSFSPSSRKGILWWIASARRPDTRAKRIEETVRLAAQGVKANHPKQ